MKTVYTYNFNQCFSKTEIMAKNVILKVNLRFGSGLSALMHSS